MLLIISPFLFLVLAALCRAGIVFSRKVDGQEQRESLASWLIDVAILSAGLLLLIIGFFFDLQGVPGGKALQLYVETGQTLTDYASLSHQDSFVLCVEWTLGFISYWVLKGSQGRLSPIVYTCCSVFLVLCILLTVVYFIHTGFNNYSFNTFFSVLFLQTGSLMFSLMYLAQLKRSLDLWGARQTEEVERRISAWQQPLYRFMHRRKTIPWIWSVFLLPVHLVVQLFLILFGQRPDSIVRAFLDTSSYHLSQLPSPPPEMVSGDGHYLCTVAARGHHRLVKPIRAGIRHGEVIPVNRQLMVANAFENVLEQYTPAFHRIVRQLYDKYGYPVSRHIRTKLAADVVYVAMKPLEWLFLIILYTVDAHPEDRIHMQYSGFRKRE